MGKSTQPLGHTETVEPAPETFVARLSSDDWAALTKAGSHRRYPAGTTLFMAGDVAHEVMVVLEGEAKALVPSEDGREVILNILSCGSLLGEVAAIDHGVRSASVQALSDVEVLAVRSDAFDDFLIEHPRVLRDLAVVLATRLRDSDRRQLEFGVGDSLGRLCRRLVDLADRHGTHAENGVIEFESPVSQSDLGSWSGLSREAIVKSMKTLRDLGWIESNGRSISLLEPDLVRDRSGM